MRSRDPIVGSFVDDAAAALFHPLKLGDIP